MPAFIQVLRGRLLVNGGDDEREVAPGDLVYLPDPTAARGEGT